MIATFEDEPYRAPFSGNVIELCPVGALTSTQYRFEARPWEIQNVPTVCGMCPVGCNINATTREGKVKRDPLAQPPRGGRRLALRQGPLRVRAPARGGPRRAIRSCACGAAGSRPSRGSDALDEAERLLREADGRIVTALSGSETVEQAYALGKLLRRGLGAHAACFAEEMSDALDAFRAPLSAIRDADVVVVLGDGPVVERAPVVELWIKEARRRGARVLYELDEDAVRDADRAILIWCGPGGHGGATVAALAQRLGASGAFYIPDTANGRGVCDAWSCSDDAELRAPIRSAC